MEEQSLIFRRVDEHGKHSKKIYFTEQGRQILSTLQKEIDEVTQQIYSGLNQQQLDAMTHTLIKIEENARISIDHQSKS